MHSTVQQETLAYTNFQPELIVEVTNICDRACLGCYAPNLVSKADPQELILRHPDKFINPTVYANMLSIQVGPVHSLSLRGGEPTGHPLISEILSVSRRGAHDVYLETHGRWILDDSFEDLLTLCRHESIIVKMSFDRMHGLASETLRKITEKLSAYQIQFLIAITAATPDAFLNVRSQCDWVRDDQIIFQKKAFSLSELIRPKLGVIHVNGTMTSSLGAKASFEEAFQ